MDTRNNGDPMVLVLGQGRHLPCLEIMLVRSPLDSCIFRIVFFRLHHTRRTLGYFPRIASAWDPITSHVMLASHILYRFSFSSTFNAELNNQLEFEALELDPFYETCQLENCDILFTDVEVRSTKVWRVNRISDCYFRFLEFCHRLTR